MPEATHDQTWSVADAKARLSELLEVFPILLTPI